MLSKFKNKFMKDFYNTYSKQIKLSNRSSLQFTLFQTLCLCAGTMNIFLTLLVCLGMLQNQGGDYFPKFFRNLIQVAQIYFGVESFGKITFRSIQYTYNFCKCQKIKMADIWDKRPQFQKSAFQKPNKLYTIRSRILY